jgi:multidrug efflux system outer membrane protein
LKQKTNIATAALLLVSTGLSGCLVGPKYKAPAVPTTPSFVEQDRLNSKSDPAALIQWWKSFGDDELSSLIQRTIAGNLDVEIATARLKESRATLRYTSYGDQLPTVNIVGEFTKSKTSRENPQIPKIGSGTGQSTLIPNQYGVYQAYFDASYEIDLFGSVRHTVRAAAADAQSYEDSLRDKLVSAVAEVARDYILLRQYQKEIAVAQDSLLAQKDTLKITEVRYKAGLVTDLDKARAAANVASTEATIPSLQTSEKKTIHAIAVLLGQSPETLYAELQTPRELPQSPPELAVGLPSDLLRRRPDIRQAERNLAAATERVGVQVASLFPSLKLTAQYGGQSGQIGNLADSAARYFSYGPQINWGLLNYPAAKQDIRIYRARQEQQYSTYKKTVLTAFQDVDDSLVAYNAEKQRQLALQEQVRQTQRSFNLAQEKYTRGLTNFLDVLDAQRSLLTAQNSLVESQANLSTDLIALYKAVGGGWQLNDPAIVAKP